MTIRLRPATRFALPFLVALVSSAASADAQQPPACRPESAGIVACMAGRMCVCAFERAGRMTGAAAGWRWDCGILRPACGGGPDTPAATGDYPEIVAPALEFDRRLRVPGPRPPPRRP